MKRAHIGFVLVVLMVGLFFFLKMEGVIPNFEMIQSERMLIEAYLMENRVLGVSIFALIYIAAIALSIPIATPLTLLSGFLFGAFIGTIVVILAATIGATIIFLLVRFFFEEAFSRRLKGKMQLINGELSDHGFRDVLLLRLAPVVPFALINAGMALTKVKLRDYVLATFLGIAPFTFVYVLAGRQLGEITSLRDIISFETIVVLSLVVLSTFIPLLIRRRRLERSENDSSVYRRPQE